MNKQRSVTVELLVIFLFIAGVSAIIWNSNPFGSSPSISAPPPIAEKQSNDIGIRVKKSDKWQLGKDLFKSNCAVCHNPFVAQTGPALKGALKRWQDAGDYKGKTGKQWMYSWIRNWNDPVASQDPYAVSMQNYAPSEMQKFPALKDTDIDAIIEYVENPAVAKAAAY